MDKNTSEVAPEHNIKSKEECSSPEEILILSCWGLPEAEKECCCNLQVNVFKPVLVSGLMKTKVLKISDLTEYVEAWNYLKHNPDVSLNKDFFPHGLYR